MEYKSKYTTLQDEMLLNLSKSDINAFDEIYYRYFPLLLNIVNKESKNTINAEDIVQEVLISLYQKRHFVVFKVSLKAYLIKAVRFKILNELRSQNIRMKYCKNDFSIYYCKNDFSSLEIKELSQHIDRIYDNLPQKCKEVFDLSRKRGYSQKDISKKLSISLSTVEKHISKALKTFREQLN